MKQIISWVIRLIEQQIKGKGKTYLLKLEDFDTPDVYWKICQHFSAKPDLHFIANLEHNKYEDFRGQNRTEWNSALDYLSANGYAENTPLTMFRNRAAEHQEGTTLLLLMGAEAALDKGSLNDFNHISMSDIVQQLKKDYSIWFSSIILAVSIDPDKASQMINNIYKDLFRHMNVDPMQLSRFVDDLDHHVIESIDELIEHIYATLREYWKIPSIRSNIKKPGKTALKYISNSYQFIHNTLKVTSAKLKQLPKKLETYADSDHMAIDVDSPFEGFSSYTEFGNALNDFLRSKSIDKYRPMFLKCDFGIITQILGLSVDEDDPKPPKEGATKLKGEPLTVYLEMLLHSWLQFRDAYGYDPLNTVITVTKIRLSNCISSDDSDYDTTSLEAHFKSICTYMGGLLDYIKEKGLKESDISVDYEDRIDPFMIENLSYIKSKIKAIQKWGEDSEIDFTLVSIGDNGSEKKKTEFKWKFSPYANWKNAFSLLRHLYYNCQDDGTPEAPLLTHCSKMDELLASESEDEFFIKLESIQCEIVPNYSNIITQHFHSFFNDEFSVLHLAFGDWTERILEKGFFSSIDKMNKFISCYTALVEKITKNYSSYPLNVKTKIGYILNIFNIISGDNFIDSVKSSEVIVPAYHPAMLEKIIARCDFIIFSFAELMANIENLKENTIEDKFRSYGKLAAITQGVDMIPCGTEKLICRNVWGFYALYYGETKKSSIGSIELIPEENDSNSDISEQSNIIKHHVLNYIKTFPSRIDGLDIAFVSPSEIQYVVEGINKVTTELEKRKVRASLNIIVICFGGSKNVGGYLKYWLNNYLTKERTVSIKVFLQYLSSDKFDNELKTLLQTQDICFIYDILKTDDVQLEHYTPSVQQEVSYQSECQFPMTFIPDTISSTHDVTRKVNISQMQFLVSNAYTQLTNRVLNEYSVEGQYKVMQILELQTKQNTLLDIAHNCCRWVVCVDRAIDRGLLGVDGKRRIIGFTTGEGCFGEYNVTVSARGDLLKDIEGMLRQRLIGKFTHWSMTRAENAAKYCIELTKNFDGSRILKALNPYDYEIHNFLAYTLIVKIMGLDHQYNDHYVLRSLINLDNYQHWFEYGETRPDFMLIEIPLTDDLLNIEKPIEISVKIIECKMSTHVEGFYSEAASQVLDAYKAFSKHWSPENYRTDRRYWFTQLYRAVVFSQLSLADNDPRYQTINDKIYHILDGAFHIDWSREIYAFDLKSDSECTESTITNDGEATVNVHTYGQLAIQRMLMGADDGEQVTYIEMNTVNDAPEDEEQDPEEFAEIGDDHEEHTEAIPSESQTETAPGPVDQTELQHAEEEHEENDETISANDQTGTQDVTELPAERSVRDIRILLGIDKKTGEKIYWEYGHKSLNNRHLLINGNSGCGKTYCIQGMLMSAARQGVSAVIFDYTGGFTNTQLDPLFKDVLGDRIVQRLIITDKIPVNPFVRHQIQIDENTFIPGTNVQTASKISEIFTSVYSLGEQQKSAVYQAVLNGLNNLGDQMTFQAMAQELDQLGTSYAKSVLSKIRPFIDMDSFRTDDSFNWGSIRDADGMVYVIQLAGYERPEQVLLTEILLWDIWSFCVKTGNESKPFILVMDEAQNLDHGEKSPSAKILTEGRKFGISGWYATQFMKPQLTDDEIQRLQQSVQKLYFCPPDDGVETVAKNLETPSVSKKDWIVRLKRQQKGECVTCGSMVKNGQLLPYQPKMIRVPSMQERLDNE